jgi:hypothetical protein
MFFFSSKLCSIYHALPNRQMFSPFQQAETYFFLFDSNDLYWNFGGFKSLGVFACEVIGYYS